jgi:hypothetical protein
VCDEGDISSMRVPLHPGVHLTDRAGLEKLRKIWVESDEATRLKIIQNIYFEIEAFADVYLLDQMLGY